LEDSETVTITVNAGDTTAPKVTGMSPAGGAIQVPTNNLITLHVTDSGDGVDANSVEIKINGSVVYAGDTSDFDSASGHFRRSGTKADYVYTYQANEMLDYDETIGITVNASDLAGNKMNQYTSSFKTEMRSFGENKRMRSTKARTAWLPPPTTTALSGRCGTPARRQAGTYMSATFNRGQRILAAASR
jgi:hypothetical protein